MESCPFNALYIGTDYERWSYRFADQILQKEDLAIPKRARSGYAHPEVEKELPAQVLLQDMNTKGKKKK